MHRLLRDETGMTMGLVVIMLVLIGVMGAGLLTFVQRDLGSVVEVNQGQKALEMSDVGIDAAKRHLANVDAQPINYNDFVGDGTPPNPGDSPWSDDRLPDGTLDPASVRNLFFDNNNTLVGIQYLPPSTTAAEASNANRAPEVLVNGGDPADECEDTNQNGVDDDPNAEDACAYPNGRDYFRITARGTVGGAVRQVEAIYSTEDIGFPVSYYATRDIIFGGTPTITGVSIFAERDITNLPRGTDVDGADQAYGDWVTSPVTGGNNAYNSYRRPTTQAGAAAGRDLTYKTGGLDGENRQKAGTATPQRYGQRDFDRNSDSAPISSQEFRGNDWGALANQPSNVVTFPFDRNNAAEDEAILSRLKEKAMDQDRYSRQAPGDNSFVIRDGPLPRNFPPNSNLDTVYFVEFAGGTDDNPIYGDKGKATFNATTTNPDNFNKGIIVVVNGDLETANSLSADTLQGVGIVRDGIDADSQITEFVHTGGATVQGFVNVEGDMKINGTVGGVLPGVLAGGLPGIYDLNLWSWRECYTPTCV